MLECELHACENEELQEGLRKRITAAALGAALALGGGGAAKAGIDDISGNVNLSRGAVAAKTTDAAVKSAVDKALANPGQSQSASSEKGRMRTTVSGGINISGKFGGGGGGDKNNDKEKKQKEKAEKRAERQVERQQRQQRQSERQQRQQRQSERQQRQQIKTTDPSPGPSTELAARKSAQQARLAVLQRKNKFTTKYRYAVPTGTGGRFNTRQASGANQMTDFKAVKTNRTGGTNYQRTKVVGDPSGPGGTGNTVSAKRYDKLFGNGGKYAPKGDGSSKYVPDKLGKPFNSKGYQPNKFVP